MKRSFLFVGAKPARASARRWTRRRRRQEHERVCASLHLRDCARHERANRCSVLGSRDEVGEKPGGDAVLERVADDGHTGELASPVRAEAPVVARRVEVAPVEVRGIAREVIAVARPPRGHRASSRSGAEALDTREPRARGGCAPPGPARASRRAHPHGRGRTARLRTTRSGRAHSRSRGRSIQPSLRTKIGYDFAFGKVTVSGEPEAAAASSFSALQRREHALPAVARVGRDVHRDREARLGAVQPRPEEAHRRDADDLSLVDGERHDPLARRVAVEPPGELLVRQLRRPHAGEQRHERLPPLRRVSNRLEAHRVAVPSTLLKARRAYVPGTVSFTEMRSQAPARTSSNVRGGYGSTL